MDVIIYMINQQQRILAIEQNLDIEKNILKQLVNSNQMD